MKTLDPVAKANLADGLTKLMAIVESEHPGVLKAPNPSAYHGRAEEFLSTSIEFRIKNAELSYWKSKRASVQHCLNMLQDIQHA